eukprot:1935238-Rhodomonas_salina.2
MWCRRGEVEASDADGARSGGGPGPVLRRVQRPRRGGGVEPKRRVPGAATEGETKDGRVRERGAVKEESTMREPFFFFVVVFWKNKKGGHTAGFCGAC